MKNLNKTELTSKGYTHVSFQKIIDLNGLQPLDIYEHFKNDNSIFFESAEESKKSSRFSIICFDADEYIEVRGKKIIYKSHHDQNERESTNPLDDIDNYANKIKVYNLPENLPFSGGLIGYFGYEIVSYIEEKLHSSNEDDLNVPDIFLLVSHNIIVVDNLQKTINIIINEKISSLSNDIDTKLSNIENIIKQNVIVDKAKKTKENKNLEFTSRFIEEDFKKAVIKAKSYITKGDVMQVVLSQRLSNKFESDPFDYYRYLRKLNPSPYMYYLNIQDFQIIGSSPEILVKCENNEVTVRPIAGTRKRGKNNDEDESLKSELLKDPKELAEHLMLIDLGRNDIGRITKTGSVKVTEKMIVEKYSHVMHIVSNVCGTKEDCITPMNILKATFPAGTVSGAPKIRAMEIIAELEPTKRGIYSGAIGYISWNGNLNTAIAIRTAIVKNKQIYVQAGAGIVYDSDPDKEWEETMNKAKALLSAVTKLEEENL